MKKQQSRSCFLGPAVFKNDPSSKPEGGCWWWAAGGGHGCMRNLLALAQASLGSAQTPGHQYQMSDFTPLGGSKPGVATSAQSITTRQRATQGI